MGGRFGKKSCFRAVRGLIHDESTTPIRIDTARAHARDVAARLAGSTLRILIADSAGPAAIAVGAPRVLALGAADFVARAVVVGRAGVTAAGVTAATASATAGRANLTPKHITAAFTVGALAIALAKPSSCATLIARNTFGRPLPVGRTAEFATCTIRVRRAARGGRTGVVLGCIRVRVRRGVFGPTCVGGRRISDRAGVYRIGVRIVR